MTAPILHKVVRIFNGEVLEVALEASTYRKGEYQVWLPRHLKKDGGFPANRRSDGSLEPNPRYYHVGSYARYDVDREVIADGVRVEITALRTKLSEAEDQLMALYCLERYHAAT